MTLKMNQIISCKNTILALKVKSRKLMKKMWLRINSSCQLKRKNKKKLLQYQMKVKKLGAEFIYKIEILARLKYYTQHFQYL